MEIYVCILFLFVDNTKRKLLCISFLTSFIFALPQLLFLKSDVRTFLTFNPGFLSEKPLTIFTFLFYWINNLGLSLFTIPLGIFLMPKKYKPLFISFFGIFIIANIFQFNSQMINNHKFFNLWVTVENLATIYLISRMWPNTILRWAIVPLCLLLTFTGITDVMVIKNESVYAVSESSSATLPQWIIHNTNPSDIFLIPDSIMYNPITMAGRKVLQLSPRYGDDYGYDIAKSDTMIKRIYQAESIEEVVKLTRENNIHHIVLPQNTHNLTIVINNNFFTNIYPIVYTDATYKIVRLN